LTALLESSTLFTRPPKTGDAARVAIFSRPAAGVDTIEAVPLTFDGVLQTLGLGTDEL